jgi:hypothetical protein
MVHALPPRRHHPGRLAVNDERHQVEEVATLLDEGAAGVLVEAVPVSYLRLGVRTV